MKQWSLLLVSVLIAGCASNSGLIPYNVTTRNCLCERFETKDADVPVSYVFSAWYRVDEVITTQIVVDLINKSLDTLDLSLANIKVSSRNIPYTYNDKFIPIQIHHVLPGEKRTLTLNGESIKREGSDPWLKIAGEELVVTLKGMRMRFRTLRSLVVTFVPQNPKLRATMEACPNNLM
jgi:hypothetical protein